MVIFQGKFFTFLAILQGKYTKILVEFQAFCFYKNRSVNVLKLFAS